MRYRLSATAQADVVDALAWSQERCGEAARPRHLLIQRVEPDGLVVGRVLHDAMELARHLDAEDGWRLSRPGIAARSPRAG